MITIANLDKYIHAFFHFVFTLLWVLFFRTQINNANKYKPLLVSFVFSVFFGILIEMLQLRLTTTRHADALDVLANIFGAILAVLLVLLYDKIKLQNTNK
ncbi:VanZ family protein [Flavobacterium crassostreae]|uniref:VanZ family protein n=1 Tax=Flavobacterium crassostreae TaxID=1763534 RepID=UPI001E34439D|nr:VanZ family protein [Flavobacterium crassostreae]